MVVVRSLLNSFAPFPFLANNEKINSSVMQVRC